MKLKKTLCLLLSIIMIIATSTVSLANSQLTEETDIYDVISKGIGSAEAYLCEKLTGLHNDSGVGFGSDWAIITLLRAKKNVASSILDEYTVSLTETVKNWDANVKPTDAAKAILAFTVLDKDVTDIEGVNLINLICNSARLESGANELAYSLLALYASNAEIPQDATWSKRDIIDKLLTFQTENGGFGLFDTETTDTDMTAICLQALAPYRNEPDVAEAIDEAVVFLTNTISANWDYDDNPNTTAQVLLAVSSLGIDVTDPANGFGTGEENIVTSLERYRSTDTNGYVFGDSVNTLATYQVMQAYDAYRKIHKDSVSYWDFGTDSQAYDDLADTQDPAPEENEAEPVDVFVTIVDDGNIVTDKNGGYVAQTQVTVSDRDRNGTITVDEALYATHEVLYNGGAETGYSTFVGDHGLSLAILWGRGTPGVSASAGYFLNNIGCWSLNDVVNAGDYLTAFNYYDTTYYSDSYSYFIENTVSVNQGTSASLTLNALGYDENWNTVSSPFAGAKVSLLGTDADVLTTNEEGKVEISTSQLQPGTYYAVAYTETKNIVPAVCKITVAPAPSLPGGGSSISRKIRITVKVMVHGDDCENSYTYRNNASEYDALVSTSVTIDRNDTVYDALEKALDAGGIDFTENDGYVSEIGGYSEFAHGNRSGWMFTVNGKHKNTGCREIKLTKDSSIVWYYTDDYTKEQGSQEETEDNFKEPSKPKFGLDGKNKDITYKTVISEGKTFADIADCKAKAEIEALAQRGIINGKTEESYDPYATMTRAEFASIVVNALGLPQKDGMKFEDITDDEWYAPYIKTAYHYGIVNGISRNQFNPQGTITLEEASAMVARAANLGGIKTDMDVLSAKYMLENFEDFSSISAWAFPSLGYCLKDGILNNDENILNPKKNVTREEIAVMIYKMLGKAKLI